MKWREGELFIKPFSTHLRCHGMGGGGGGGGDDGSGSGGGGGGTIPCIIPGIKLPGIIPGGKPDGKNWPENWPAEGGCISALGKPTGVFSEESRLNSIGGGGGGGGGVNGLASAWDEEVNIGAGFTECFLVTCIAVASGLCDEEWPCPWWDDGLWLEDPCWDEGCGFLEEEWEWEEWEELSEAWEEEWWGGCGSLTAWLEPELALLWWEDDDAEGWECLTLLDGEESDDCEDPLGLRWDDECARCEWECEDLCFLAGVPSSWRWWWWCLCLRDDSFVDSKAPEVEWAVDVVVLDSPPDVWPAVVTVAYLDVRGGSGGKMGGIAVKEAEELAALDAVTVEETGNGLSLSDSFRFSFSLSLSFSVFCLCDDFPSRSFRNFTASLYE